MNARRSTTSTSHGEVGAAPVRVWQLRLAHVRGGGAPEGRSLVTLDAAPVVVGREAGEGVGLVVPDSEISREHAAFELSGGRPIVRDLGSRNGVLVGGVRVERAALDDGAVVRLGRSLFLVRLVEFDPLAPLAPETRLLGPSVEMQRVRGEIALVAPRRVPVLVLGESGVGKELVAEELHQQSGRRGPLVPVNCASLTPELAESELFGHEAGAFTGASRRRQGLFAAANGGTLFLDEVGELPPLVQPKLLRALASGEVRPLGAEATETVDVRVIAATHRDVESELRADLVARLAAWTLAVPPLRARRDDVLPLARAFLARDGARLSTDAAQALLAYPFPRNVRELEQVLGAAAVRAGSAEGLVRVEHLPEAIAPRPARAAAAEPGELPLEARVPRDTAPSAAELELVARAFDGNVARVAAYFRKDRQQIYRWAKRLGVDLGAQRPDEP